VLSRDPLRVLDIAAGPARDALAGGLSEILRGLQRARGARSFGVCGTCRFFDRSATGGEYRCGLLGVALTADDSTRICAEHETA
jgi:hypothetical protein